MDLPRTIQHQSPPRRLHAGLRAVALLMVLAVLGLPVNDLVRFGLLVLAALVIFTAEMRPRLWRWFAALALAVISVAGQIALQPPPIEEGHNVFLPDAPDGALAKGLPAQVYQFMAARFEAAYPRAQRCAGLQAGCDGHWGRPQRLYAFSADGLLDRPEMSRRVTGIGFADPVWLRLGFVNEGYNWNDGRLERARRDRRAWAGPDRWHVTMPFWVAYRLPAAYAGGQLCWRGDLLWEQADGTFAPLSHAAMDCRTIAAADAGRRLFGVAVVPDSLAMRLDPPQTVTLYRLAAFAALMAGLAGVLALLVRPRWRATVLPAVTMAGGLLVIAIIDASFIGGWHPYEAGDDGLAYETMARQILQYALAGDWWRALEGTESVFYYGGPGLRYLLAAERVLFGDTSFGYLAAVLGLPMLVFALLRRLLGVRWALALVVLFVFLPVGALFGTAFLHYAGWAGRGFADPAAYIATLAGVLVLLGRRAEGAGPGFGMALGAALLLALGVLLKPVVLPFAGLMLAGAWLFALGERQWRRAVGLCIGFIPVTFMALHNWVFGHRFVLLSSNATEPANTPMPPAAYAEMFRQIAEGHWVTPQSRQAIAQLVAWLSGPSEAAALIPLHLAAVLVLAYVVWRGRAFDRWVRLLALAALVQHLPALFYSPTPRYYYLVWLVTLLVNAVWIKQLVVPYLARRFPYRYERVAQARTTRWLADRLDGLQLATGYASRAMS